MQRQKNYSLAEFCLYALLFVYITHFIRLLLYKASGTLLTACHDQTNTQAQIELGKGSANVYHMSRDVSNQIGELILEQATILYMVLILYT